MTGRGGANKGVHEWPGWCRPEEVVMDRDGLLRNRDGNRDPNVMVVTILGGEKCVRTGGADVRLAPQCVT